MATLEIVVSVGDHDVRHRLVTDQTEYSATQFKMGTWSPTTEWGYGGFFEWSGLSMGQGDTIDVSYISLNSFFANTSGKLLDCDGMDEDNPEFDGTDGGFHAFSRTTAFIDWSTGGNSIDVYFDTPSMNTVVQEIVDRAGYASNHMILGIHDERKRNGFFKIIQGDHYEGAQSGQEPRIHVEFTSGDAVIHPGSRGGNPELFWFS